MSNHTDKNKGLFWGSLIILFGALLLLDQQGWIDIGDLWPMIIIAVGVWMIIRSRNRATGESWYPQSAGDQTFVSDVEQVMHSNVFGDVNATIHSKDYQGGQIRTTFGDVKVDLTNLNIKSGEKELRLSTTFGDIKITAPKNLTFSIEAANTAGDMKIFDEKRSGWHQSASYKSEGYDKSAKKLKIIASQIFGDLKVW